MCVCVCVYTDSGAAVLDGRMQNDCLKFKNLTWHDQQIIDPHQSTLYKRLWFLNSWFLFWTAILIMCPCPHKPSYATGLKEYQLSITSAVMDWLRAQKGSLAVGSHDCKVNSTLKWTIHHPPVNQLTPTSINLPFQTSTAIIGSKSNLLVYINFIQHWGNILFCIFGGHLCRLLNYIWLVIIFRLAYACLCLHNTDQTSLDSRSP